MTNPKDFDDDKTFEERMIQQESSGASLVAYAAIKYFSWIVIVVAILYFIARYILPML